MRRTPHAPGLTYYDANAGCLVEEAPDLLDIKGRIREMWPDVQFKFHFDFEEEKHVIVQVLEDGTEALVLTAKELDQRVIDRLYEGRPEVSADEVLANLDKENAALEREKDRKFEDAIGDAGERLAHALKKDGLVDHEDISGGRSN